MFCNGLGPGDSLAAPVLDIGTSVIAMTAAGIHNGSGERSEAAIVAFRSWPFLAFGTNPVLTTSSHFACVVFHNPTCSSGKFVEPLAALNLAGWRLAYSARRERYLLDFDDVVQQCTTRVSELDVQPVAGP